MRDRLVEKLKKHDEKALSQIIEQQSRFVASVIYNTSKGTVIGPPLEPENIFVNIKDIESVTINGDTVYRN